MNRCHQAAFQAKVFVEHFHHWREAVGGAARVGDNLFVAGEVALVDAQHNGGINLVLGRCTDDHLLGTRFEVFRGSGTRAEETRRLHDHVASELVPGQIGRVFFLQNREPVAVNDERAAVHFDGTWVRAVRRVVFEQRRQRVSVGQVVDANDVEIMILALENGAKDQTADTAKSVDAKFDRHKAYMLEFDVSEVCVGTTQTQHDFRLLIIGVGPMVLRGYS